MLLPSNLPDLRRARTRRWLPAAVAFLFPALTAIHASAKETGTASPARQFQDALDAVADGVRAVENGEHDPYTPEIATLEGRLADVRAYVRTDPRQQLLLRQEVLAAAPGLRGLETRRTQVERRLSSLRREKSAAERDFRDWELRQKDDLVDSKRRVREAERALDEGEARSRSLDREVDRMDGEIRRADTAVRRDYLVHMRNEKAEAYNAVVRRNRILRSRFNKEASRHNALTSRVRKGERKERQRRDRILGRVGPQIAAAEREYAELGLRHDRLQREATRTAEAARIPRVRRFLEDRLAAMRMQHAALTVLEPSIAAWQGAGRRFLAPDLDGHAAMVEIRRAVCIGDVAWIASAFCAIARRANEEAGRAVTLFEEHANRPFYETCAAADAAHSTRKALGRSLPQAENEPPFDAAAPGACITLAIRSREIQQVSLPQGTPALELLEALPALDTLSVRPEHATADLLPRLPTVKKVLVASEGKEPIALFHGPDCAPFEAVRLEELDIRVHGGSMSLACVPALPALRVLYLGGVALDGGELGRIDAWPSTLRNVSLHRTGIREIAWMRDLPPGLEEFRLVGKASRGIFRRRKIRKACKQLGVVDGRCHASK